MSPSSLIFVAVVAVWAAYLVIDTTRRREFLATAQSVDRFSASMRVLQRRAVRRESAEAFEASTAPMRSTSSVLLHRHPNISRAAAEARAAEAAVKPLTSGSIGGTPALAARQRAASRLRRARRLAVATFGLVLATVVTAIAAGVGLLTWLVPAVGILLSTGLALSVRREAVRARGERRAAAPARSAAPSPARTGATAAPVAVLADDIVDQAPSAVVATERRDPLFDYARDVAPIVAAEDAARASVDENDPLYGMPGWQPVPVPPPTYTLKARAEHPLPPPLEVEQGYEPFEDEWVDDDVYYRAAGQ